MLAGPTAPVPMPAPMPIKDMQTWKSSLHLSNFVNTYYQFRDLQTLMGVRSVLIVGSGSGLDAAVLRWRGYQVLTVDIDDQLQPDVIGSVHNLNMFADSQFDAVIASHVLEHLAEPYLDTCLMELARVARHALIYLPVHGRHLQLRFAPGLRALDFSLIIDWFNYLHRPDGVTPRYMAGQHYWEVGMRGFRAADMRRRLSRDFTVLSDYRNRDWIPSYNFVLASRRWAA